jgi:hypothetical protein
MSRIGYVVAGKASLRQYDYVMMVRKIIIMMIVVVVVTMMVTCS